jgi:hypothetical protein
VTNGQLARKMLAKSSLVTSVHEDDESNVTTLLIINASYHDMKSDRASM